MGSVNYLGQVVWGILQNSHLKTNIENSKLKILSSLLKFQSGEIFLKKCPVLLNLNAHISRPFNARELNEAILKLSH